MSSFLKVSVFVNLIEVDCGSIDAVWSPKGMPESARGWLSHVTDCFGTLLTRLCLFACDFSHLLMKTLACLRSRSWARPLLPVPVVHWETCPTTLALAALASQFQR